MRRIVSNTGPLLHLKEAQAIDLLHLAGEIHIPNQVVTEIVRRDPTRRTAEWISVDPLDEQSNAESLNWQQAEILDKGEAEALALAKQIRAEWFLTDDAAARLVGKQLGMQVHGSLGIVLWAAAAGHLDRQQAEATLERVGGSSLWVSNQIMSEAKTALSQLFEK